MLEFLLEPILFVMLLPVILWQLASKPEKRQIMQDVGIALILTLILVAIKYNL